MIHKFNYDIKTGISYDGRFITDITAPSFKNKVFPIKEQYMVEIPFDEIKLRESDEVRHSKVYYFPNENVYANNVKKTEFKKSFHFYSFFDPEYITRPGFVFKLKGEWYHFITNCEFALKFVITNDEKKVHICFNSENNDRAIYKIGKGHKELLPKYFLYMYELDAITPMLMNYFLFDGIRFLPKNDLPYIADEKKKLIELLDGLNFYFMGTSIYDYARDIDIHVSDDDYDEVVNRMELAGYTKNKIKGYTGTQYANNEIKIDVVLNPYSNFPEAVDDYHANHLLMYFIQLNYFCSIAKDIVTTLFKEYRYNRLLITQKKMGIDFEKYGQYVKQIISNERTVKYVDNINNVKIKEINSNNVYRYTILTDGKWEYLAVSMKEAIPINAKITIPYSIRDFEVLDDVDNLSISMYHDTDKTNIVFSNVDHVALIRYKVIN